MKDKEKQIEEMLSKLKSGYFCQPDCYGCCGDGYLDITCNVVVDNFIGELHNAGYRKVPAGTLILTENRLKMIIEEEYKNALKGKIVLTTEEYQDLVVKSMSNFSSAMVKARKETAKDILQEWADDNKSMGIDNTFVKNIAEKYGVEIEE